MRCCLACIERLVQFLNETAYIQIALRGKNFCGAAMDGFQIVLNNGIRYATVAGVGKLMMFVGRILIAIGSTFAFYILITFATTIKSSIMEPIYMLVVILVLFSWFSSFPMQLEHYSWVFTASQWIQSSLVSLWTSRTRSPKGAGLHFMVQASSTICCQQTNDLFLSIYEILSLYISILFLYQCLPMENISPFYIHSNACSSVQVMDLQMEHYWDLFGLCPSTLLFENL